MAPVGQKKQQQQKKTKKTRQTNKQTKKENKETSHSNNFRGKRLCNVNSKYIFFNILMFFLVLQSWFYFTKIEPSKYKKNCSS